MIDLPRIKRPSVAGLVRDVDSVRAEMRAYCATEHDWEIQESDADPAWRLLGLLALREVMVRQSVDDSMAQTSLAFAGGPNLDSIGLTYFGAERLEGETDDAYRRRAAQSTDRWAVGLSAGWYRAIAMAVPGVIDAQILGAAEHGEAAGTSPGVVTLYVLADAGLRDSTGAALYPGGAPNAALLAAVTSAVTADDVRQQTDRVRVRAAGLARWDAAVTLTMRSEPDSAAVLREATAALKALAADVTRIGAGVPPALVTGAVVDPAGVRDATVAISRDRAAVAAAVTVGGPREPGRVRVTAAAAGAAGNSIRIECGETAGSIIQIVGVTTTNGVTTIGVRVPASQYRSTADAWVAAFGAHRGVSALVTATVARPGNVECNPPMTDALTGGLDAAVVPAAGGIPAVVGVAPVARSLVVEAA